MDVGRPSPISPVTAQAQQTGSVRHADGDTRQVSSATDSDNNDGGPETRAVPGSDKSSAELAREQREVERLQRRDREVRAHEQAHLNAAGSLARGGANFTYKTGPDGQRYAVGGEVQLESPQGRTPEETLQRANTIRAAALAPVQPSPQDLNAASRASRVASDARADIAAERQAENQEVVASLEGEGENDSGQPAVEAPEATSAGAKKVEAYNLATESSEPDVAGVSLRINVEV